MNVNVGLIGFGTVGSGVAKILQSNNRLIEERLGGSIILKKIADLDIDSPRPLQVDRRLLTTEVNEVLDDPEVSIVDAVVHRGRRIDVDTVIVDGEVVMRGRKLTRVDEVGLYREVKQMMSRPATEGELERRDMAEKVEPYLRKFFAG